jgi:hypothetical protein
MARVQLDDILVMQHMVPTDGLPIENAASPHASRLQMFGKILVDSTGEIQNRTPGGQRKRCRHVRRFAGRFRINSDHVQRSVQGRSEVFETLRRFGREGVNRETITEHLPNDGEAVGRPLSVDLVRSDQRSCVMNARITQLGGRRARQYRFSRSPGVR